MGKSLDEKIREALMAGTREAPEQREEVFKNIQASIQQKEGGSTMAKGRKNRPSFIKFTAIAALFALLFLTTTQYGQAAIDKIKILFDPQKKITEQIEGTEEEKEYTLREGQMGYVIYIDESMYEKQVEQGKDRILPIHRADYLPEMYIEITQEEGKTPDEVAAQLEESLRDEYPEFENLGKIQDPVESIHLSAKSGIKHDDVIVKYYLVDNTRGGAFIIKTQYTLEAAEGHGARFYHMLKEFKVVNLEDLE